MAALSLISIASCLVILALPQGALSFYLLAALIGGAAMPMYSVCIAYANDRLEPQQIVAASGALVMAAGIGSMTGPVTISFFMDLLDVDFYFWGIAGIFAIILLFTLIRIGARAGVAVEDQSTLVAGPIGTPIAEYIAPDSLEYAEAVARDELQALDSQEDVTEREL